MAAATVAAAEVELLVEDDAAPWSLPDGTGYTNDLVKAAFKAVGVDARLTVVPYARCRGAVVAGQAVGCFNMAWDDEFAGKVRFAETPLYANYADVFERKGRPLGAKSVDKLAAGKTLGIVNGYEYPDALVAARRDGHLVLKDLRSEATALKLLAAGRLDGAVVMTNDIEPVMKKAVEADPRGELAYAFRAGELKVYIGFSEQHPAGPLSREQFNEGYRIIVANGTLERLRRKWFPQDLSTR
jgi:ABC-type amino acid transport substrate-binding protein